MVSILPVIFTSSSLFNWFLRTIPITIGITVVFMFHSFQLSKYYYYCYYYYSPCFIISLLVSFFLLLCQLVVSHLNLSDCKSPYLFRALLSLLADLDNALVPMISIFSLISNLASLFLKPQGTVLSMPTITGISIIFMLHSFFSSLARSKYLPIFCFFHFHFLSFSLWILQEQQNAPNDKFFFSC